MSLKGSARGQKTQTPRQTKTNDDLNVTFWGVRGTLPTPGKNTLKYGGHTSCVEVQCQSEETVTTLVFDAGSGLAKFGDHALARGEREFHLFLSHMHYDHIMGLTKFAPLFRDDCKVTFYGQAKLGKSLLEIIKNIFAFPYFPVLFEDLPNRKNLRFIEVNGLRELKVGNAIVQFQDLNHPQSSIGFRVWDPSKNQSVVYATDHEHGTGRDAELIDFSEGASLFIYDSTYTDQNYSKFKGWGHATAASGAKIAKGANVGAFAIFHHDPDGTDAELESHTLPEARKIFNKSFLSREGHSIVLSDIKSFKAPIEQLLVPLLRSDSAKPARASRRVSGR